MHAKITTRQRQRLERAIDIRIREYARCQKLLRNVDKDAFAAGVDFFESESALALWLCAPAQALNNKVPLRVMRNKAGRAKVAHILHALDYGVLL